MCSKFNSDNVTRCFVGNITSDPFPGLNCGWSIQRNVLRSIYGGLVILFQVIIIVWFIKFQWFWLGLIYLGLF
jgi:hypothetical protein